MLLLGVAIRTIPIGTAYAVWVGIGAAGALLVSVLWRREATSLAEVGEVAALVASIVAVKMTSVH
ncbi:MAG: DMT family transporter [Acidimicrobiia bacterium]